MGWSTRSYSALLHSNDLAELLDNTALNVSPLVRTFTLWETIIANEMLIQYLTDVDFNSFLVRTAIVFLLKWSVNTVFNRVFYVLLILINSTQFYKFVNFRRINIHGVKNKMCKLFSIINAPIFKFFDFFLFLSLYLSYVIDLWKAHSNFSTVQKKVNIYHVSPKRFLAF